MKRVIVFMVMVCLLLSGCGMLNDSYVSVTPHRDSSEGTESKVVSASNYSELRAAFVDIVHSGMENGIIHVSNYNGTMLEQALEDAAVYVQEYDAIGAYAVEKVEYEIGTNGVIPAVAVTVSYRHNRTEIQQIQTVQNSDAMWSEVEGALERCDAGILLLVEKYTERDLIQLVEDYAVQNPDTVMEVPQVTYEVYPDNGDDRVVELKFTYQNSRTDLRQMQGQVQPIFNSAALYVSGDSDYQKISRLYTFLMERFSDYQVKTSITPSYSLLHHGVGDSRAFAMVYARMCRMAGIDCRIVTGTHMGEPWSWNMVENDGCYYHVDLLCSHEANSLLLLTDDQMEEYVWDYSAYPVCTGVLEDETGDTQPEEPTETEPENYSE